jgi:predicted TIM-barrel fold metal-dependent hydrolase
MSGKVVPPILLLVVLLVPATARAESAPYRGPIIDVHLHAYGVERFAQPAPNIGSGLAPATSAEDHLKRTLEVMKQRNVVLAIVSSQSVEAAQEWRAAAPDRILRGFSMDDPSESITAGDLDRLIRDRKVDALAEIGAQYAGLSPSDPVFDSYWAVAEKHGIPVGIHTGGGPPRSAYTCCPKFRLSLGDPLLLEDLLVRFPRMKVYAMHAGGFFTQNALALMSQYPHVYVDIGALSWTPIAGDLLVPFLKEAQARRLLERVMFGTDQMRWPAAIGVAIDRVNGLDFLTVEEKKKIFYDNAVRFLGRTPEGIARDQAATHR